MKKNDKIMLALFIVVVLIVGVVVYITQYQRNYRAGIKEWIIDYNNRLAEYNEQVEQNNTILRNKKINDVTLKKLEPISESLSQDRDIKNIYNKLKELEKENETVMEQNGIEYEKATNKNI